MVKEKAPHLPPKNEKQNTDLHEEKTIAFIIPGIVPGIFSVRLAILELVEKFIKVCSP